MLLSVLACNLCAQPGTATQSGSKPVVSTTTNEVVLDVVARDKKGRPARDLEQKDFQITDDGAAVAIRSFRLVDRGGGARTPGADPAQLDPLRQIRLVSLVFDTLGQESRVLAGQAALDLIKREPEQNVYFAVFTINQRLNALQQFTNDRALLRKAIGTATGGAYTTFAARSEAIQRHLQNTLIGASQSDSPAEKLMAQMLVNMLKFDESMSIEQQGRSSIFSLRALVREQYRLPGRKAVLYFSEGIVIPVHLDEAWQSVKSAANRANVSVYAVDARGLLTSRQNSAASSALDDAAKLSRQQVTATSGGVSVDEIKSLDSAQQSTRLNVQNALAELSEGTGGLFISNSNDLRNPLRRMTEDLDSYYEIAYEPDIKQYDGRFRRISVKLDRSDVRLQTRAGYFALPPNAGPSMLPYEVPLLAALSKAPLPRGFAFHSAVLRFDPQPGGTRCALIIEVPLKEITFSDDKEHQLYRTHFSLMALLKTPDGDIVQKFSRDLPLQGPLDKKAAFQDAGRFIYTQDFVVPWGRYILESAVLDREGEKISARRAVFVLPQSAPGLNISNLTLVRRFDPQGKSETPKDPFIFQTGRVIPTLMNSVTAAKGAVVSIYFVIYPNPTDTGKPQLFIQFYQEGKLVGQANPDLPAAGADGRIPYIASSPVDFMKPGQYEVRAVVKQGQAARDERTFFQIEP